MIRSARRSAQVSALMGRGRGARALAGILLAFQFFASAGIPVLDARTDHADQVVAHIEDAQHSGCPVAHDPETCQICQVFAGGVLPASGATAAMCAPRARRFPPNPVHARIALAFLAGNTSRAPPIA